MNARFVLALVGMRLRRIVAERANIIWLVIMPLIFSFLMGMLMGNWSQPAGGYRYTLIVYGAAEGGDTVQSLLDPLREHPDFDLVVRDTVTTIAYAQLLLEERRVSGALLVPTGYADSLAAGHRPVLDFYHDSDRTSSQRIRQAVESAFAAASVRQTALKLVDPNTDEPGKAASFYTAFFDSLLTNPRVRLESETLGRSSEEALLLLDDSRQHSGPSYTLMFILMFLLMSAKDLVLERKQRTLDRLRLAHPSTTDLVAGFFLAGMVVGLAQAVVLLLFNTLIFGIDYGPSPGCLALVMVLFVGISSAAGLLLGTLSRSGGQADGLGMVFGLGMPALGGLWWPLEIVPPFMQNIGRSLPTGQAITIFHDMIGRGWGVAESAPLLLGMVIWLVVLLSLAVFFFRRTVNP